MTKSGENYAQDIGRQILERELDRNHYDEVLRGVDSLYRIEGESSDLLFPDFVTTKTAIL